MSGTFVQKVNRVFSFLVALALLFGLAANYAQADPVVVVLNTGFSGGGLVPQGSQDPNWVFNGATDFNLNPIAGAGPAWVVTPNGAWFTSSEAGWIGPSADSGTTKLAPGLYTYSLTFDLASGLANLSIVLDFGTDDLFDSITLNGISLLPAETKGNGFKPPLFFPFSFASSDPSLFNVGGSNVLQITVHNKFFNNNNTATGLILRGSITATSVPEPATGLLLISGFLAAGVLARFRS